MATGFKKTTASPARIFPALATVSAVRPSLPSHGPAGEDRSATRTATMPASPSSRRPA